MRRTRRPVHPCAHEIPGCRPAVSPAHFRRLGFPTTAGRDRLPTGGEPYTPRAARRASSSPHRRATSLPGCQGQGLGPEGAARGRRHRHPRHGLALVPPAHSPEVRWKRKARSWTPASRRDDPQHRPAHGQRERNLGMHPPGRGAQEPWIHGRAEHGEAHTQ